MTYQLSIVVCTHNRSDLLKKCLESLVNQTYSAIEIIVIDNNSTDDTRLVVSQFPKVIYYFESKTGLSYARNTGYEKANGRYVAYIDDDAYADKFWCEHIIRDIELYNFDVGGGKILPYYESKPPFWFSSKLEIRNYGRKGFVKKYKAIRGFSGSNIIFKKEHLVNYKGFNTTLGMKGTKIGLGEESELCYRIAQEHDKFYYNPLWKVYHYTPNRCMTLTYRFKRNFTQGVSVASICKSKRVQIIKKLITLTGCLLTLPFTLLIGPYKNYPLVFFLQQITYRIGFFYGCVINTKS